MTFITSQKKKKVKQCRKMKEKGSTQHVCTFKI